jgi:hypothetical protein
MHGRLPRRPDAGAAQTRLCYKKFHQARPMKGAAEPTRDVSEGHVRPICLLALVGRGRRDFEAEPLFSRSLI